MEEGYDCNDDRRIERDAFELIMRIRFALKDLDDDGLLQGAELEDPLLFTR